MITFSIELDVCDLAEAFRLANIEAAKELYHKGDYTVCLLNISMLVDDDVVCYIFNFQASR